MGLKSWIKKKAALVAIDKAIEALKKEGGPMSPKIKEYIEGAFVFVLPSVLLGITDAMGANSKIDFKVLLILSLTSLAAYIRTRPTQQ